MKQSLAAEYACSLICTIVIVENEAVKLLLNSVFSTIYKPIRPVRLVKTPEDANTFITLNVRNEAVDKLYSVEK